MQNPTAESKIGGMYMKEIMGEGEERQLKLLVECTVRLQRKADWLSLRKDFFSVLSLRLFRLPHQFH